MFCQECSARSICQSSCPELELYIKEIERPQRELLIGTPRYGKIPMPKRRIKLSIREQQIVRFMAEGKSPVIIGKTLNITRNNVDSITNRLMSKIR